MFLKIVDFVDDEELDFVITSDLENNIIPDDKYETVSFRSKFRNIVFIMEFYDINNLDVHVEPYESWTYVIPPYLIKNGIILLYDKDKLKNTELGKYIDGKIESGDYIMN